MNFTLNCLGMDRHTDRFDKYSTSPLRRGKKCLDYNKDLKKFKIVMNLTRFIKIIIKKIKIKYFS